MKIAVESSAIFRRQKTGVGYYSSELVKALIDELPNDQFLLCYISFITKEPEKLQSQAPNVSYRRVSLIPGKIYNALDHYLVALPFDILARAKADVFLFPNFFRWPLWLCKHSVVVIHDLSFLDATDYITDRHRKYLTRRVPQSAHRADHVIAISEYTKQRLMHHYGLAESKITVVTPAIDHTKYHIASPDAIAKTKEKYGITRDYLLYLGTIEPRKNIAGILTAYRLLTPEQQATYQLVLAGGKGWLDGEINQLAAEIPAENLVRTGYVDDEDKAALYGGATVFLYPSKYEGWGMQVVEAMACNTPVITARNSSLVEAGGMVAAYTDDDSAEALARTINAVLTNPGQRESMSKMGLVHAASFTWQSSARQLATVLQKFRPHT